MTPRRGAGAEEGGARRRRVSGWTRPGGLETCVKRQQGECARLSGRRSRRADRGQLGGPAGASARRPSKTDVREHEKGSPLRFANRTWSAGLPAEPCSAGTLA
ncbi:hypothetical protein [Corynebacterium diphtheriae]|uniref:hypothetical protein n=1 Tax=Corynebacterium diphtheriae TaxID=1717 RepID=UPI0012FFF7B5|nr:hypothetical protein [Corynebacterium diphtheriae]